MPRKNAKKSKPKAKGKRTSTTKKKARKIPATPKKRNPKKRIPGLGSSVDVVAYETRGLGANSAGQAGDIQGLPGVPVGDSESMEELLEEGQTYEAEVLNGVENARDADKSEVKTREVPEDDVPDEYREKD